MLYHYQAVDRWVALDKNEDNRAVVRTEMKQFIEKVFTKHRTS